MLGGKGAAEWTRTINKQRPAGELVKHMLETMDDCKIQHLGQRGDSTRGKICFCGDLNKCNCEECALRFTLSEFRGHCDPLSGHVINICHVIIGAS